MSYIIGRNEHRVGLLWLVIVLLGAVIVGYGTAVYTPLIILAVAGALVALVGLFLLKLGLYKQLVIFLSLLEVFTFIVKVGYGVANTTILALLPSAFIALMLIQIPLLIAEGKLHFHWTLLDWSVIAFFLLDLLQVFNPYLNVFRGQPFLSVGLRGFQQRSFLGLTYFVVRCVIYNKRRFNTLSRVLNYSIALNGLYAIAQQLFGFVLLETRHRRALVSESSLAKALYAKRAIGFLTSSFTFGMVSAIGVLCGVYLLTSVRLSWRERFLVVGSLFLSTLAVLLSGSRSTYLALIMAIVLVLPRVPWRRLFLSLWRARIAIVVIVIVGAVILLSSESSSLLQYSVERIASLLELSELVINPDQVSDVNFAVRRELAMATLPLILKNPLGYGTGIFNGGSNPNGVVKVEGYSTWVDNEFSSLALELGLPGVFLLVTIVILAIWRCRRVARIPGERDHAIALIALVAVCPIAGFGGQWLAAYPANVLFWVFAGIIANLPIGSSFASPPSGIEDTPES
jgi:hypothetical protein